MSQPSSQFRISSLLWSVYLPTLLFAIGQGAALPILPLFALDMKLSVAAAGALVAVRSVGILVFDVPAGIMISRYGERKAMAIGAITLSVVAFGIALRPPVAVLVVLVFLMGGAWSIWFLARLTYATEVTPLQSRGRVMSLIGGLNRSGNFIGPLIGAFLITAFDLTAAFFFQAATAIAATIALYAVAVDAPTDEAEEPTSFGAVGRVLREHRSVFATGAVAVLAMQVVRSSRDAILPLWGDHIGLIPSQVAVIFGLSSLVETSLFYPTGYVMDRHGRKWTAVPCLLILSIGLAFTPLTSDFASLLAVGLVLGVGNGFGMGINMTLGSDFSPPTRRAEFLGVWRLVTDTGTVGGPVLVSVVIAAASLVAAPLVVSVVGLAGTALVSWAVPETLRTGPLLADDP